MLGPFWYVYLCHPLGIRPTPEAVRKLLEASASFSPATRFDTYYEDGGKQALTPTIPWLDDKLRQPKVLLLNLGVGGQPTGTLFYRHDFGAFFAVLFFKEHHPPLLPPAQLARYFLGIATAHDAPVSTLYTDDLSKLTRFGTWPREALTDEALVADESTPEVVRAIPRQLALRLTSRIHILDYDRGHVPEAVGWMNLWSASVIELVGRNRILAQPWEVAEDAPGGGLFLVASLDPPDRKRLDLLERVARIGEGLELEALRRKHSSPREWQGPPGWMA